MPMYTLTNKDTGKTVEVLRSEEERDEPYTNPDDGLTYHRAGVELASPHQHVEFIGLKQKDGTFTREEDR